MKLPDNALMYASILLAIVPMCLVVYADYSRAKCHVFKSMTLAPVVFYPVGTCLVKQNGKWQTITDPGQLP